MLTLLGEDLMEIMGMRTKNPDQELTEQCKQWVCNPLYTIEPSF